MRVAGRMAYAKESVCAAWNSVDEGRGASSRMLRRMEWLLHFRKRLRGRVKEAEKAVILDI
jgi:hypothetical protein